MRTPFRSPLGKTKANSLIEKYIPAGNVVSSYGLFSGDVELHLSNRGRFVLSHTTRDIIYDVWETLCDEPYAVSQIASRILPFKTDKDFNILQEEWYKYKNPMVRAALFFILNNCSDGGYISKGNLDLSNYNPISLSRLKNFVKPDNLYFNKIDSIEDNIKSDQKSDFLFFNIGKYKKDFLIEGLNKGVEEEEIDFKKLLPLITNQKYVILTKPSRHLFELDLPKIIFLDQYGREATQDNAKEIILHNVR